ncbi:MAG: PLP-dependent aminotransferase family protein [Anaerolineales bacterium]
MSDPGKRQADSSTFDWESHLAARAKGINPSIIREILKLTVRPDVISFAGGLPAPELFPIKEFDEACHHILETEGEIALQYSLSEGYMPLRQFLADSMSQYMNKIEADNILIVNGSQQGLELIGKIFIDPGTKIVCSRPTYLGALQAWTSYQARYISVPLDEQGMCVDEIPALLQSGDSPRIVYVLPNFHNPAGTTLPLERRERLVEIAREYDLIIVEDDPYRELRYEGEDIAPVYHLAPERTIYLSTFSKTLAPGIRLAWTVAAKPAFVKLIEAKQAADLHTGTFVQMVANRICQSGTLRKHVKRLVEVYRNRRNVMLDALEEHWPKEASWTSPHGGLFLWAQAPASINTRDFLETAVAAKVAYVPGFAFYPYEKGGEHAMRLNFSNASEEMINEGIFRLGRAMKANISDE